MIQLLSRRRRWPGWLGLAAVLAWTALLVSPAVAQHGAPDTTGQHAAGAQAAGEHGEAAVHGEAEGHGHDPVGDLPLWTVLPFVGILLSIAVFPLVAPHFWHHHFAKISAAWALIFAIPFLFALKGAALQSIIHIYLIDYIPFIILLWSLFTIAGGIVVEGRMVGSPRVNVVLLLIGTLLASWIGTTGAAMLMIRPVLRANAWRRYQVHVVCFFIFLVANIGGSLTPLGDPPLFLGFLHGVPFFWVTTGLLKEMAVVSAALLVIFFFLDTWYYRREPDQPQADPSQPEGIRVRGLHNLLFLGGVMAGVILSGSAFGKSLPMVHVYGHVAVPLGNWVKDGILILMGVLSLLTTSQALRKANGFNWFPIKEVAYLFAGIFMTIIPALAILKAGSAGAMAPLVESVREPWQYFWVTGSLSSFLDNAPTYLTFFNAALGQIGATEAQVPEMLGYAGEAARDPQFIRILTAISAGAVFMGANTYIGNAPNFMVKSIAEEQGVPMPSFFGYLIKYALVFLVPLFVVVTLIFFL